MSFLPNFTASASFADVIAMLRASGEPTRLRLLALLTAGELNVRDLCRAIGQSQPRISRHLKLLVEAGLVERRHEGSFVFFRLTHWGELAGGVGRELNRTEQDDGLIRADFRRLGMLRADAAAQAQAYFANHAVEWDAIRALHMPEAEVEAALARLLGDARPQLLVDLGTGTGRMLELFGGAAQAAVGYDMNREMLGAARARLAALGLPNVRVGQADLFDVPLADGAADLVILHQVLHFVDAPARAVAEAARLIAPGGRLLIVDFAPHGIEALRESHAHRWLGFAADDISGWLAAAGLRRVAQELLSPDVAGKLTVSIWLAERDAAHV